MSSSRDFGASMGRILAEARSGEGVPKVAAAEFIEGVFQAHPRVKLPELLANEDVRAWMERAGVSEGSLRTALTETRRLRRSKPAEEATIRIPPRPRGARKHAVPPSAASAPMRHETSVGLFDDGIVPNRPPQPV